MSQLEIHVLTGKNREGDYVSHSVIAANDPDAMIRASMIDSGAKAAAMMVAGHARAIADETATHQRIEYRNQRLIGE